MFRDAWTFAVGAFLSIYRRFMPVAVPLSGQSAVERPAVRKAETQSRRQEEEEVGRYYTFSDVLERLEEHFDHVKRLRKHDPQNYDLFSKIGTVIVPPGRKFYIAGEDKIEKHWKFPTAMMVSFPKEKCSASVYPRLFYLVKMTRPSGIERTSANTIYNCYTYWDMPDKRKAFRGVGTFHIGVHEDGRVVALREVKTEYTIIQPKRGNRAPVRIPQKRMSYGVLEYCERHGTTIDKYAAELLYIALQETAAAQSGFQVLVEKGDVRVSFAIDMLRSPYFFKDREMYVNENGRKKRIFHYVRPYTNKHGTLVRSHFRGLNKFAWHGYRITITMPGLHHDGLMGIDIPMHEGERQYSPGMSPDAGFHSAATLGATIAEAMTKDVKTTEWRESA